MTWSYSQLKREFGEDRALELLADQKGLGEYKSSHAAYVAGRPERADDFHGLPIAIASVGPSDLDLESLAHIGESFATRSYQARNGLGVGTSVGERCGVPWYGEPTGSHGFNRSHKFTPR